MKEFEFNASQIMSLLPHKYPFLLVDKAYKIVPDKRGYGEKLFSINEWFFSGHFPGEPIVPGVLLIESLAQLTALVYLSEGLAALEISGEASVGEKEKELFSELSKRVGYLVKVDVKFLRPVRPGEKLIMYVEMGGKLGVLSEVRVRGSVDTGEVAVEGRLFVSQRG